MTADTMPMPATAARAPSTDFSPAPRSCAAPRSSRAQLKARRRAGGAGATELVQQWAQRSKRSPRGPCRRVSSPANAPPRHARPRRACPFSRCAPGAAGAGRSRSSAPAPLRTLLGGVARAAAENAYTSGRAAWLTWMQRSSSSSVQENHVFARFSGFLWQLGSWFSCFLFIWGWPGATVFSRKRAKNELSRLDFGPHLGVGHAHPSQRSFKKRVFSEGNRHFSAAGRSPNPILSRPELILSHSKSISLSFLTSSLLVFSRFFHLCSV